MNTSDFLQNLLNENKCLIEESHIALTDDVAYWHSTAIDKESNPISSGFAEDRNQARKIALSEFFERTMYKRIKMGNLEVQKKWGLNLVKSGCGFAAGFDKNSTCLRSINEAVERWTLSKWIDEKYIMEHICSSKISNLTPIEFFFTSQFDHVDFYSKKILLNIFSKFLEIEIFVTVAFKDNGVFLGSGTPRTNAGNWAHALLESFRHLLAVRNNKNYSDVFPQNRVFFFSKNKEIAISQINQCNITNWPMPTVRFQYNESFLDDQIFLSRTILNNWQPWEEGPVERFLY